MGSPAFTRDEFGLRLVLLGRRWRTMLDERLHASGLTDATWRPLIHLRRLAEAPTQRELAARLGIEGPSLVPLLDALAARGLLERQPDPQDRRARRLALTPAGVALADRLQAIVRETERGLLAGLDEAAFAALAEGIERIEARLGGAPAGQELRA